MHQMLREMEVQLPTLLQLGMSSCSARIFSLILSLRLCSAMSVPCETHTWMLHNSEADNTTTTIHKLFIPLYILCIVETTSDIQLSP